MHKHRYFIEGIKAKRYTESTWVIKALTVGELPYDDETIEYRPFDLVLKREDNSYLFYNPATSQLESLEGTAPGSPPLRHDEAILLKVGDLPNIKAPTKTSVGNVIANVYTLIHCFGSKVEFQVGKLTPNRILNQIEGRVQPTPPKSVARNPETIYIDELLVFLDQISALEAFWGICVPTGSPKSMGIDPAIIVERDRLLALHADRLDDPVVVTQIENQLIAMDKKSFEGDVAQDFFIGGKSFNVIRKKSYIMVGLESGLGDKPQVIKASLQEGFDPSLIPASADAARAASYARGALTAQGGELVNYLYRIFQNTKIVVGDCGTKRGLPYLVTEKSTARLVNRFYIDTNGKTVLINQANVKTLVGKKITLRSPGYCVAPNANFCANCLDSFFALAPHTLHTEASKPGSVIMNDQMKAMHGRESKVALFDYKLHLT